MSYKRLDASKFLISKSQKKIWKKFQSFCEKENVEITRVVSKESGVESYILYKKYQMMIHGDCEEDLSKKRYETFLVDSPLIYCSQDGVQFGSFHEKYYVNGKLVAVEVVDILPGCFSSVYFF